MPGAAGLRVNAGGRNILVKDREQGAYGECFDRQSHDLQPVPRFGEKLGAPTLKLMEGLKAGRSVTRCNWALTVTDRLDLALAVPIISTHLSLVSNARIFRVGTGAGVITDSVKLTDVNGRAAVGSWRLGTIAGAQT